MELREAFQPHQLFREEIMASFESMSAAAGLPLPKIVGVRVTTDRLAKLLRTEAESKNEDLAEWLCRELVEYEESLLKTRILSVISEHLEDVS